VPQTILCDESGFTGNDLSNADQPHFVYAGIAISPEEADEIKTSAIQAYQVNGNELKGKQLIKHAKGRRVVSDTLDRVLLNQEGRLEIQKTYSGQLQKPKCTSVAAFANHPTAQGASSKSRFALSASQSEARMITTPA
jgi:hypothetical protein